MRFVLACLSILWAHSAWATGTMSGGGGGEGIVCHRNGVTKVQLLDLWEAQTLFNRKLVIPIGNLVADVDRALVALRDSYPMNDHGGNQNVILSELRVTASYFLRPHANVHWLRGATLDKTKDSHEIAWPHDCPVEQIVNYQAKDQIYINTDLFDKMDEQNQAALIVHEALYALLRNWAGEANSIRARRSVGYVFAGNSFKLATSVVPSKALECVSSKNSLGDNIDDFWLYTEAQDPNAFVNIAAFIGSLGNSHMMGSSKPVIVYSENARSRQIADFVNTGKCEGWESFSTVTAFVEGPVEGDRSMKIQFQCQSGQISSALLTTTSPGVAGLRHTPLACKMSSSPSWHEIPTLLPAPMCTSVYIADGVYHCNGGSGAEVVVRATYDGSTLVGVNYAIPKNRTVSNMTCAGEVCSGVFSGFPGSYSIKIKSLTSYTWENSNFQCGLIRSQPICDGSVKPLASRLEGSDDLLLAEPNQGSGISKLFFKN